MVSYVAVWCECQIGHVARLYPMRSGSDCVSVIEMTERHIINM